MAAATKKTAAKAASKPAGDEEALAQVNIERVGRTQLIVPIRGTAPLLVHRFSEKAKRIMLENMQGKASPKEPKDPDAEYESAFYFLKGSTEANPLFGFPAIAFKAATVSSARLYGSNVTMVGLRQTLFFKGVPGDDGQMMVQLHGEPAMREDVVRVGRGGTDLRYRPSFNEWIASLHVLYVKSMLTRESVLSLIEAGGMAVGVGEWRPEKGGDFGTYEIDPARPVEELTA